LYSYFERLEDGFTTSGKRIMPLINPEENTPREHDTGWNVRDLAIRSRGYDSIVSKQTLNRILK
jgi:hypothetical protein